MTINNSVLAFCFAGAICSLLVGAIVYSLFDRFSACLSYDCTCLVCFLAFIVSIILWSHFAGPLFDRVCSYGHKSDMSANFCSVCGEEFEPSCDCGYSWQDESFCPKCGNAHVE